MLGREPSTFERFGAAVMAFVRPRRKTDLLRSDTSASIAAAVDVKPEDNLDRKAWEKVVASGGLSRESVNGAGGKKADLRKLAFAVLSRGDIQQAEKILQELGEALSSDTWISLAESFIAQSKYKEGIFALKKANAHDRIKATMDDFIEKLVSGSLDYNINYLSELFYEAFRRKLSHEEYIALGDSALSVNNTNFAKYVYYEVYISFRGKPPAAVSIRLGNIHFEQVLKGEPEYFFGSLQDVEKYYRAANYRDGLIKVAHHYIANGGWEQGLAILQEWNAVPEDPEWMDNVLQRLDRKVGGLGFLIRLGNQEARIIAWGEDALKHSDSWFAIQCFKEAKHTEGLKRVACWLQQHDRFTEAYTLLQELGTLPTDPSFYEKLGREYVEQRRLQEAHAVFRMALELERLSASSNFS